MWCMFKWFCLEKMDSMGKHLLVLVLFCNINNKKYLVLLKENEELKVLNYHLNLTVCCRCHTCIGQYEFVLGKLEKYRFLSCNYDIVCHQAEGQ